MTLNKSTSFSCRSLFQVDRKQFEIWQLKKLNLAGLESQSTLPYSLRVLLENLLRSEDGDIVTKADIEALANWDPSANPSREVYFHPGRVVWQDYTGIPALADLTSMREAWVRLGQSPSDFNPVVAADFVVDHSIQVDSAGSTRSLTENTENEFQRNRERYEFLRWGAQAFDGIRVVPPGMGIVHQVNLEFLSSVVASSTIDGADRLYPDTLVGADSHTTMINALGVLGWGVGGIQAEAAMLGEPIPLLIPRVVGVRLTGQLRSGVTATDLVLRVVEILRSHGVVGSFVEFCGDGLASLSLPNRATIANMAPEYGATVGFFPTDQVTLSYLRFTGRTDAHVKQVERYLTEQNLLRTSNSKEPRFSEVVEIDLDSVVTSIAGPKRPQDRIDLSQSKNAWKRSLPDLANTGETVEALTNQSSKKLLTDRGHFELRHGHIVIAALTSCTNTSNPSVMLAAGLVAKKAREVGLTSKPWVKTSMAPGSQVVTCYLQEADLLSDLEYLGFHLVGYGCTTCIGNSGPLPDAIADAIERDNLVVASVLSGNRNFEGRISPVIKANYLASPPLVVAYALAGTVNIDFETDPIGVGSTGETIFLRDLWPSPDEIEASSQNSIMKSQFVDRYSHAFDGTEAWEKIDAANGLLYSWDPTSTYVRKPPFFDHMELEVDHPGNIEKARALVVVGDSVTTDHISPSSTIPLQSPAGAYLANEGVAVQDFSVYGSRRANHEVGMRATFANVRLRNELVTPTEGGFTRHLPSNQHMTIFDAAVRYQQNQTPTIVIAGAEYGIGSSRDWAAKGTLLLGVKAVIATSFERIHRSNLIGVGVLPLQFVDDADRLALDGTETFSVSGINDGVQPGQKLTVEANEFTFNVVARLDTPREASYYNHGGILPFVLRSMIEKES